MIPPSEARDVSRLVPDEPFPLYSFVPGLFPHPSADPTGHSYGRVPVLPQPLDPAHWQSSRLYLYGIDLFNFGYYWEAHEAWEELWQACGRRGLTAIVLKGLIHLAAAGVKVRERRPEGVRSHGLRAAELFRLAADELNPSGDIYLGLSLAELGSMAQAVVEATDWAPGSPDTPVKAVWSFALQPKLGGHGTQRTGEPVEG
jgi:hypothetical protein